jgi:hypothetical protein
MRTLIVALCRDRQSGVYLAEPAPKTANFAIFTEA